MVGDNEFIDEETKDEPSMCECIHVESDHYLEPDEPLGFRKCGICWCADFKELENIQIAHFNKNGTKILKITREVKE